MKRKPKVTFSHYVVLALFSFVGWAAWLSNMKQFHEDPFALVLYCGLLAHLTAYGGLCALVGLGLMDNSE